MPSSQAVLVLSLLALVQVARAHTLQAEAGARSASDTRSGVTVTGGLGKKHRRKHGHGNHNHIILDRENYRYDADEFLRAAKRLRRGEASFTEEAASGLQLADDASMCDLTTMTYQEVITKWSKFQRKWMKSLPKETPPVIRRNFFYRIREAFPEVLFQNNPVVIKNAMKELGWNRDDWAEHQMRIKLNGLNFAEMYFAFPTWMAQSPEVGLGNGKEGHGRTVSFAEYLDKGMSTSDIFLFLAEEDASDSPRIGEVQEDEAIRRLRNILSPAPPFGYPGKDRRSIVAIDGIGSSHGFHSHTAVWQVQVHGHKMWHLMPPTQPLSMGAFVHGGAPVIRGKPFNHPNACAFLKKVPPPPGTLKCLAEPGDMLILPGNWVHATCGLENYTAAAGGWMHPARPMDNYYSPVQALESQLEYIHNKLDKGGFSKEDMLVFETDEEGEAAADLTEAKRLHERSSHPFDFIDKKLLHTGKQRPRDPDDEPENAPALDEGQDASPDESPESDHGEEDADARDGRPQHRVLTRREKRQ